MSTVKEGDRKDTEAILQVICQLIGFLIANIVKTEQEWSEWGRQFLQMVYLSQFEQDVGDHLFSEFELQFFPIIGHGIALWLDETISAVHNDQDLVSSPPNQGFEDYVMITSMEDKLSKILAHYLLFSAEEIENTLNQFFTKFYQYLGKIDHYYDSRERNIARKVCSVLNLSAHQFSQLEKELQLHSSKDKENDVFPTEEVPEDLKNYPATTSANNNTLFLTLFQKHSQKIPRESLLVSYRMWRVAFIAAGGGAVVGLAGFIAAPSIVSTVLPVLCSAGSFTQLSVTLDTFLSYVGVLTYPLIPSIFTTYGATVAGSVMLKRTAAIKDFELLPLHIHDNSKRKASPSTEVYDLKDKTGIPIFILVNGHVEKHVDPRVMWGANGADVIIHEQTISTATAVVVAPTISTTGEMVVEKKYDYHPDTGIVTSTLKELQDDLLQESQLIAATIVESLHAISPSSSSASSSTTISGKETLSFDSFEEITTTTMIKEEPKQGPNKSKEKDGDDVGKEMHEWEELDYSYSTGWWKEIVPYGEEYILSWENDLLGHLTESFLTMIKHKLSSTVMSHLKEFFYQQITPLHAIKKSIGLPNLALAKIRELDDVWIIAMDRALQGGKLLAKILLKQYQPYLVKQMKKDEGIVSESVGSHHSSGELRPITLVGYGMGARLIYHCLEALIEESRSIYGNSDCIKGIIENVVFIGAPVKIDLVKFQQFREIVSSRLINCYSRYDWILALLYRSRSYEFLIAGLYPIYLPGQRQQQPTKIANQKELLFISKLETNEVEGVLSIELGEKKKENEEEKEQEELKKKQMQEKKEREVKDSLKAMEEEVRGIENYDVTDIVYLQTDYPKVLASIMKLINLQSTN